MERKLTAEAVLQYVVRCGTKYPTRQELVAYFSNASDSWHYINIGEAITDAVAKEYIEYTQDKKLKVVTK
jgi:hypothetical protein